MTINYIYLTVIKSPLTELSEIPEVHTSLFHFPFHTTLKCVHNIFTSIPHFKQLHYALSVINDRQYMSKTSLIHNTLGSMFTLKYCMLKQQH